MDLERAVIGALRSVIHDHGPITSDLIGSAAKRILGALQNSAKQTGSRRWRGVSAAERKKITSRGGRAAWASMTPEERSAEMRRRAAKRKRRP